MSICTVVTTGDAIHFNNFWHHKLFTNILIKSIKIDRQQKTLTNNYIRISITQSISKVM